jgi:ribonuclease HI
MAATFSKLTHNLLRLATEGANITWGDLNSLRSSNIAEYGVEEALLRQKMRKNSPRRASSGMTSEELGRMFREGKTRKERNAWRRAHYTRKAELEAEKEAERLAEWRRRHPHETQANWERREAARKTRRAAARAARKATRGRRSSSNKK